ncbi:MAG: hypothetical protein CML20_08475 [Rheinheimera sp.]|uniref:sugar-transfer associated ATP-grasp domain-containing protein n=1 Tax=Arsukibacterium sp. UBA3155 TaxID=1946058 RepID=UPI000C8FA5E6|nr:sugar-transfer associated ATP-grasp domain-containing protein [Arsukibacterium sp. UBA3155]MAD74806.1 hypothetical protein [Rheinheimera sp.]|tara:strand:- start:33346 stop:34410 length:1065 start_codon:yes stop_codon:yes gene_type:complete
MDYPNKFYAYLYAINAAALQAKTSRLRAFFSVFYAKLRYNIGPAYHSVYELSKVKVKEWPEYLVDAPLIVILGSVNKEFHRNVIGDKALFWKHCKKSNLKTVDIFNRNDELLELSEAEFIKAVPINCSSLFIKPASGSRGEGSFSAQRSSGAWSFLKKTGTLADLYQYCQNNRPNKDGWLIQPKLSSHPDILTISSNDGLSTLRIVSHRRGKDVKLAYGLIKLVAIGNIIDNFKTGRLGNKVAAINLDKGDLMAGKGSLNPLWPSIISFANCPHTANKIEGFMLPFWSETKELITRAHLSFENLPSIGWDVAITENGPIIIEGNTNYGADIVQVAYSRGIKSELLNELKSLIDQ